LVLSDYRAIRATPIALAYFDYRANQSNTHCSDWLASVACRVLKMAALELDGCFCLLTLETGVYHA